MIAVLPVQYALEISGDGMLWDLSIVEWMLVLFAIAGHVTALQRFARSWKSLSEDEKPKKESPKNGKITNEEKVADEEENTSNDRTGQQEPGKAGE